MTKVLLDTDKAAVIEAVSGATVTDAGTPASDDKVLIQDTSDSDNLKYVNISDLPGGGVDVLSNVATARIIGRTTAGSGDSEELTAAQTRTLLNVEDDADKTDTANVEAAGALMESEVTNLAQVKAFDSTDYATAAQGSTADSAVQDTGDETIAGIKTFSSSPIVPAPTTDQQAATKKYVDDNAGGGSLPAGGAEDDLLIKQSATDGDAAWEDSDTHKIRKTYYSATEPAGLADGDIWVDTSVDITGEASQILETDVQTADYTLTLTDAGFIVPMNKSSAATLTVPTNASVAFPVGTVIGIYNMAADDVQIAASAGVTVRNIGDLTQFKEASLRKRSTNEWVLIGDVTV